MLAANPSTRQATHPMPRQASPVSWGLCWQAGGKVPVGSTSSGIPEKENAGRGRKETGLKKSSHPEFQESHGGGGGLLHPQDRPARAKHSHCLLLLGPQQSIGRAGRRTLQHGSPSVSNQFVIMNDEEWNPHTHKQSTFLPVPDDGVRTCPACVLFWENRVRLVTVASKMLMLDYRGPFLV